MVRSGRGRHLAEDWQVSQGGTAPHESVMAGGGYYSSPSRVQAVAAASGFPFLERAARQIPIARDTPS